MFIAAEKGHSQCIEVLHTLGADVNKARNDGTTPIQMAEHKGHSEAAEVIRRLAVEPIMKDTWFDPKDIN